jgi:AraC-like DNA-binding protein
MNKTRRALIAGPARLHENSLTANGSAVGRPCVEVAVRELIDRCDGSVRFSVKVVCAKLHLSQSQMAQKFKRRYHKTILEYWSEVRLNRARALLSESPARSVGSIATELGYQHSTNFTNWFTRQMGISPRQYIASVQSGAFAASTFVGQLVTPSSPLSCSRGNEKLKSS